jgi:pantoate--beta-alanine ligase
LNGRVVTSVKEMQAASAEVRSRGRTIGLVPTMGALHEGHLHLVRKAKSVADWVATSVFVNPTQFGTGEDFERYPRDLDRDAGLAFNAGSDVVFAPAAPEMFPRDFQTSVVPEGIADVLEGEVRPGHFRGVATVVTKLFNITMPNVAVFGQKDAQQAFVIRRLVRDLDLAVSIIVEPTVREPDGLALSSRNKYLSAEERSRATCLFRALGVAEARIFAGERSVKSLRDTIRCEVGKGAPSGIDYIVVLDPETFEPQDRLDTGAVLIALAVRFGSTRLIDNTIISFKNDQTEHITSGGTP